MGLDFAVLFSVAPGNTQSDKLIDLRKFLAPLRAEVLLCSSRYCEDFKSWEYLQEITAWLPADLLVSLAVGSKTLFEMLVIQSHGFMHTRGFSAEVAREVFNCIYKSFKIHLGTDALPANLDETLDQVGRILEESHDALGYLNGHIEAKPDIKTPQLSALAQRYLQLLLDGKRYEAMFLLNGAFKAGAGIPALYLDVLQPVQYRIGELWLRNQLSTADVHLFSAITQYSLAELHRHVLQPGEKIGVAVAACAGIELHEIGVRMVSDFLEANGWEVHFLGGNIPVSSLLEFISKSGADLLVLSGTMPSNLIELEAVIQGVRSAKFDKSVKILVGGIPFNLSPDLWRKLGADGYAGDALEAVRVSRELLEHQKQESHGRDQFRAS